MYLDAQVAKVLVFLLTYKFMRLNLFSLVAYAVEYAWEHTA